MVYYESPGKVNLDKTLELIKKKSEELGIKDVVLATSTGFTAEKAFEAFKGTDIILTIISTDRQWWDESFLEDFSKKLEEKGHNLFFIREISPYPFIKTPSPFIKTSYCRLSSGLWVAVYVTFFAVDKGFISTDNDIITTANYNTALVIKPATSENFTEFRIKEIICKPK